LPYFDTAFSMNAFTSLSKPRPPLPLDVPPALPTSFAVSWTLSLRSTANQFGAFLVNTRGCAPDAASAASDDDGFAFEAAHEVLPDRLCVAALAASRNFKQDFKRPSHFNALEAVRALTYHTAQY